MQYPATRLLLTAVAVLISGCADVSHPTVLNTVGPAPLPAKPHAQGYLVAYTPVKLPPINSDTLFYPHTSYGLYDSQGNFLFRVRNHIGAWDEMPQSVPLRPGRYTIRAQSDSPDGLEIPIVIRTGRTTVVDLSHDSRYSVTALNPE